MVEYLPSSQIFMESKTVFLEQIIFDGRSERYAFTSVDG
jgi:hypothetical protein